MFNSLETNSPGKARLTEVVAAPVTKTASPMLSTSCLLSEAAQPLSPLVGWLYSKQHLLENYYVYSDKSDSLGGLLNFVFYRAKGVEFEPTKKSDSIIRYLDPYSLGVISAAFHKAVIEKSSISEAEVIALIGAHSTVGQQIDKQQSKFEVLQGLVASALMVFDDLKIQIQEATEKGNKIPVRLQAAVSESNSISSQVLNAAPEELRKSYKEVSQRYQDIKQRRSKKIEGSEEDRLKARSRNDLLTNLLESVTAQKTTLFNQCLAVASPGIRDRFRQLQREMRDLRKQKSALPWEVNKLRKKAYTKIKNIWKASGFDEAFLNSSLPMDGAYRYLDVYLKTYLETQSPKGVREQGIPTFLAHLTKTINDETRAYPMRLVYGALGALLSRRVHTQADVQAYIHGIQDFAPEFVADNSSHDSDLYESVISDMYKKTRLESPVPPIACTRFVSYQHQSQAIQYPDCGETAVRNIINLLIYDATTQRYDVNVLKKCNLQIHPELIAFYEAHNDVEQTASQEVHEAWGNIIVKLGRKTKGPEQVEFITPRKDPVCELGAGGDNLLNVLNCFFGTKDLTKIVNELNISGQNDITLDLTHFDPHDSSRSELDNRIILFTRGVTVEVICNYRHYRIFEKRSAELTQENSVTRFKKLEQVFGKDRTMEALQLELQRIPLADILAQLTGLNLSTEEFLRTRGPVEMMNLMFSSRTDWFTDIENLARASLNFPELAQHKGVRLLVENLLLSIPTINGYELLRTELAHKIRKEGPIELLDVASRLEDFPNAKEKSL